MCLTAPCTTFILVASHFACCLASLPMWRKCGDLTVRIGAMDGKGFQKQGRDVTFLFAPCTVLNLGDNGGTVKDCYLLQTAVQGTLYSFWEDSVVVQASSAPCHVTSTTCRPIELIPTLSTKVNVFVDTTLQAWSLLSQHSCSFMTN